MHRPLVALASLGVLASGLSASSPPAQWQRIENTKFGIAYTMPSDDLSAIPANKARPVPNLVDHWESLRPLYGKSGSYRWSIKVYRFADPSAGAVTGDTRPKDEAAGKDGKDGDSKPPEKEDARAKAIREMLERFGRSSHKSFDTWLKSELRGGGKLKTKGKRQRGRKLRYDLYEWSESIRGLAWDNIAAHYELDGQEIVIVGSFPNEKERTVSSTVRHAIETLEVIDNVSKERRKVRGEEHAVVEGDSAYTSLRKKLLNEAVANIEGKPEWDIFCTKHYIVLYSFDDGKQRDAYEFATTLAGKMDEMQLEYRKRFPPHDGMKKWWSVFRICRNSAEFHIYGKTGGGVVGWYNPSSKELVVFNAKTLGAFDTEAVAFHEGWHQYADFWFPGANLHRWFDEGTGDFFGSMKRLGRGNWIPQASRMRKANITELIGTGKTVPLKEIVRWHKDKFYGPGAANYYAQGWSMVDFFTRGHRTPYWDSAWDKILDTYIETALATKDTDKAVDTAFKDVDWDKLEKAWKLYVKKAL